MIPLLERGNMLHACYLAAHSIEYMAVTMYMPETPIHKDDFTLEMQKKGIVLSPQASVFKYLKEMNIINFEKRKVSTNENTPLVRSPCAAVAAYCVNHRIQPTDMFGNILSSKRQLTPERNYDILTSLPRTANDLAKQMQVTTTTITQVFGQFDKSGLLEYHAGSPAKITKKGRKLIALYNQIPKLIGKKYDQRAFDYNFGLLHSSNGPTDFSWDSSNWLSPTGSVPITPSPFPVRRSL